MELDLDLMREKSGTVPPRPFQLSDSMILMAALFVALAWDRGRLLDPMHWTLVTTPGSKGIAWRVAIGAANVIELLTPFLTVGSVALLVLRLRKPRPAGHLLLRQPGTVACAVASVCMVPAVLAVLASHVASAGLRGGSLTVAWARAVADLQPENLTGLATMIGFGIAVAWIVLAATRRWQAEPGWIDRLGRSLGVGWLAMILGGIVLPIIRIAALGL